jgi:protein TonB
MMALSQESSRWHDSKATLTFIHVFIPNDLHKQPMKQNTSNTVARRFWLTILASGTVAAIVSACKSAVDLEAVTPVAATPTAPATVIGPIDATKGSARSSGAITPRAYRQDGASHIYGLNSERIFKGRMPPLLYAIGVLNVEIDRVGRVTRLDWMRAPRHAPEVVANIERTVREASPFPAPSRLGKVVYTDTWLWHKSGKFQLDTLTEGQN